MSAHPVELLSAYADGELSPPQRREVELHLDSCPGCRARIDDYRALARALPETIPPVPGDLAPRIRARLAALDTIAAPRPRARRTRLYALGAAASVVLAVLAGFVAYRGGGPLPVDEPRVRGEIADTAQRLDTREPSREGGAGPRERVEPPREEAKSESFATVERAADAGPATASAPAELPRPVVSQPSAPPAAAPPSSPPPTFADDAGKGGAADDAPVATAAEGSGMQGADAAAAAPAGGAAPAAAGEAKPASAEAEKRAQRASKDDGRPAAGAGAAAPARGEADDASYTEENVLAPGIVGDARALPELRLDGASRRDAQTAASAGRAPVFLARWRPSDESAARAALRREVERLGGRAEDEPGVLVLPAARTAELLAWLAERGARELPPAARLAADAVEVRIRY